MKHEVDADQQHNQPKQRCGGRTLHSASAKADTTVSAPTKMKVQLTKSSTVAWPPWEASAQTPPAREIAPAISHNIQLLIECSFFD
jgi:hypothetical protein